MAGALVEIVMNKLGTILKERLSLVDEANQELEILSSEFTAIQAVLHEAERRQISDESVRQWLVKLKEVAYDTDDVLDEWITSALASQTGDGDDDGSSINIVVSLSSHVGFGNLLRLVWESWKNEGAEYGSWAKRLRSSYRNVMSRIDVARRVKGIRSRLDQIAKEKNEYCFKQNYWLPPVGRSVMDGFETSSLVDGLKIIGRDVDNGMMISRLVSGTRSQENTGVQVISIIGVGGMGKTALAQLISQDERVKQHFEKVLWVCVSDDFDAKRIMKAIIQDAGQRSYNLPSELNPLQQELLQTLQGTLFLLILDDIWNEDEEEWEKLRLPLQSGAHGSKILITTRSNKVASVMHATYIRVLKGLSEQDSWSLFSGRAFAKQKAPENQIELEKIGTEIVKKCRGVPLSLKVIGSAMQSKTTIEDWQNTLESEIWALPEVRKDILPALLLSYYNLPVQLRQCFAYCSIFPKDSYIEKDKLVKMWLAQGFIKSQGRREMEDIGGEYFNDLVARSMFQGLERFFDGRFRCKMHDLLHDLAGFVVKDESRIFAIDASVPCSTKVRHASVMDTSCHGTSQFPSWFLSMAEKLRTLFVFGEIRAPDSLFVHAKVLRVLNLGNIGIQMERLPECIGELKHLRYLDLSGSKIVELPESLCHLCNLETLNLDSCVHLTRLPRGMGRMQSLRHFEIKGTHFAYLPKGFGRLTSLRTLPRFILGGEEGCKIGELKRLNALQGHLCIEKLDIISSKEEAEEAELCRKSHLRELHLTMSPSWYPSRDNVNIDSALEGLRPPHANLQVLKILNYHGLKFPTWMEDLPFSNLSDIRLGNCLNCEELPGLGTLPSLKRLTLIHIGLRSINSEFYYGKMQNHGGRLSSGVAFPKLEYLRFEGMFKLEEWELPITTTSETIMPSLQHLSVVNCCELKALPQYLPGTSTLECLKIQHLPQLTSLPVGLGRLKALKQLKMLELDNLTNLPDGFGELKELEHLIIYGLRSLASLPDDGLWQQLKALKLLELGNLPELTSLPDGLGQLKKLKRLGLRHVPRLTSLPDGLGQLTELRRLEMSSLDNLLSLPTHHVFEELKALECLIIRNCNALASLPEWLRHLTTLHSLQVSGCALLSERCARDTGADWPKILHIPSIQISPRPRWTWRSLRRVGVMHHFVGEGPSVGTAESSDSDDDDMSEQLDSLDSYLTRSSRCYSITFLYHK